MGFLEELLGLSGYKDARIIHLAVLFPIATDPEDELSSCVRQDESDKYC